MADIDFARHVKIESAAEPKQPAPETAGSPVTPETGVDFARHVSIEQAEPQQDAPTRAGGVGEEIAFGLDRGVGQLATSFYGLTSVVAESFDSDVLRDFSQEGVDQEAIRGFLHSASIDSLDSVENAGDFFRWSVGTLSQQVPILASIFASGGIGGALAKRAAASAVRGGVRASAEAHLAKSGIVATEREVFATVTKMLNDKIMNQQMHQSFLRGVQGGATAGAFGLETGGIQNELIEAGISAPGTALLGGLAAASLEALPVTNLIGRMFPGVNKKLAKSYIRGVAEAVGVQHLLESGTEAAQEVVALAARAFHDPSFDISSPANKARIFEAAVAGALVGGVTGGIGQTAAHLSRKTAQVGIDVAEGAGKMRDYVKGNINPKQPRPEAGTLLPGMAEIGTVLSDFAGETITPLMTSVRQKVSDSLDSVRKAAGQGINVAGLQRNIDEVDQIIRSRVGPELAFLNEHLTGLVERISERAKELTEPKRRAFLAEQIKDIKKQIISWTEQRIQPIVDQAEQDIEDRIKTADYGDEDQLFEESIFPRDTQRVTFGQSVRQTRGAGDTAVTSRVRTRDDDAVPFTSREGADNAVADVQRLMPTLAPDAIEVVETDGTFLIAVNDIGAAEEVFDQLRFNDGVLQATENSRANPDPARRIQVRRPGAKGFTRMDVPTLALTGADLAERGDVRVSANASKRGVQGIDTIIGRMLDQGYVIKGGTAALNAAILFGSGKGALSVGQARRRAQFVPDEQVEKTEDTGPVFDARQDAQEITDAQKPITETEAGLNRSSKVAPNKRQRIEQAARWWTRRPRVHVAFESVGNQTQLDIMDLVEDLMNAAGLRTRVLVADAAVAARLIQEGHPMFTQVEQAIAEDPAARIIMNGDEAIIYMSERVLIDMKNGDESVARMNTFAVIAHELGHLVEQAYYQKLSPELQNQLKAAHENSGSPKVFEEWMADQFVGWAARAEPASGPMETFFQQVVDVMQKIFTVLRDAYGLNETFKQFMDGVTNKAADDRAINDFARHFQNEGVTGHVWFGLPQSADFDVPVNPFTDSKIVKQLRAALDANPQIKQAAIRTWESMIALRDQYVFTLQGRLRELPFAAGNALANKLDRTPGTARTEATYFNQSTLNQAVFTSLFNDIIKDMDADAQTRAMAELLAMDGTTSTLQDPNAIAISNVLEQLYNYMRSKGLPVERINNYFPRVWDSVLVTQNSEKLMELLLERDMPNAQAQQLVDWMSTTGEEASFQSNLNDTLHDIPQENFLKNRNIILNDPAFNEFRDTDLTGILEKYSQAAVKRAEFNASFGEPAVDGQEWNKTGQLDRLKEQARLEGATEDDIQFMDEAVDAALGRHIPNPKFATKRARAVMAWVMTYQNMRLLLFSTLASIPDIVGPAIRSNDMRLAYGAAKENFADIVNQESDLNQMARVWGIISNSMNQHILNEHFDNHYFPERAREVNEKFFRLIGLQKWTNFTRSTALAVGIDFMKQQTELANNGDAKGVDNLAQLGLTAEEVTAWIEGGEKTFGAGSYNLDDVGGQNAHNQKVAQAMIQFVNESIMRPNPAQRPLWASNPSLMLVFHLKSFMYSFHNTVMRQMGANMSAANTPWQKAYAIAMPGLMLMAFAGLGLELRELIQYKMWGRAGRTDRMEGLEYMMELIDRAGLFGIAQMVDDVGSAKGRGNSPLLALSGPTVNQLNDILAKPFSQTVPKGIPIVSQIPALRKLVRDVTPLGN